MEMVSRDNGHLIYLRNKLDEYTDRFLHFEQNIQIYLDFYEDTQNDNLKKIFSIFHYQFNVLFGYMNTRLKSGHYTANQSRELLYVLDELKMIQSNLKGNDLEFEVIPYYKDIIQKCQGFLQSSNGSSIPSGFQRIDVIEIQPIFHFSTMNSIYRNNRKSLFPTTQIGGGSYASVHKYKDDYYHRFFVIKRAHKDLTEEEYQRFQTEFFTMQRLNSPYVIEVYQFDDTNRQYIMEYADKTLDAYISENNNKLDVAERVNLVRQILRAFNYIHGKDVLHRDISTKNILVKIYDGLKVIKVADFGLVKLPDSRLTKSDTEMKGHLNDPKLSVTGFKNYEMRHETYALVRLVYFVLTGRLKIGVYSSKELKAFVEKGLADDLGDRYQDVRDLQTEFDAMVKTLY
jgi:hypothetical protein